MNDLQEVHSLKEKFHERLIKLFIIYLSHTKILSYTSSNEEIYQ